MDRTKNFSCAGYSMKPPMRIEQQLALLQDTVAKLEEELFHATNEAKTNAEQKNCLVLLIQKAWTGDQDAAECIANIAGVAPPTIMSPDTQKAQHSELQNANGSPQYGTNSTPEHTQGVTMESKPKVVNNWAALTVRMLNQHYCGLERQQTDRQYEHFMERNEYLNQQLHMDYNTPSADNMSSANGALLRSQSFQEGRGRRGSARRRPLGASLHFQPPNPMLRFAAASQPGTQLGRPHVPRQSATKTTPESLNASMSDLYISAQSVPVLHSGSGANQKPEVAVWNPSHITMNKSTKRPSSAQVKNTSARSQSNAHYNPATDMQAHENLFDPTYVVGPQSKSLGSRPPSGKQQKDSDAVRAMPKGLFRTTKDLKGVGRKRPTTAVTAQRKPPGSAHQPNKRISSAPVHRNTHQPSFITLQGEDTSSNPYYSAHPPSPDDSIDSIEVVGQAQYNLDLTRLEQDEQEDLVTPVVGKIQQPITIPSHVNNPKLAEGTEEDMIKAVQLQKHFKDSAVKLQRKLGLTSAGMIY